MFATESFTPDSIDELCAFLRDEDAPRVVVRGGQTMIGAGNPPEGAQCMLDTSSLDSVVEANPDDLTITVQAGATLSAVNEELALAGQRVVLDSPGPGATIGGILATDRPGSFGYGFGGARDRVLGMTVVDGRGRSLSYGGRVVKNVSGYDCAKLFVGSYGTIGAITETTLRTHPLPETAFHLTFSFSSVREAEGFRHRAGASPFAPVYFDFVRRHATRWDLHLGSEGTAIETGAQRLGLERIAGKAAKTEQVGTTQAAPTRDCRRSDCGDIAPAPVGHAMRLRIGVAAKRVLGFCETMIVDDASFGDDEVTEIRGHLGSGVAVITLGAHVAAARARSLVLGWREAAQAEGGYAAIEDFGPQVPDALDAWGAPPAGIEFMRQIKNTYDPRRLLAPGRFVGGI